MTFNVLEKAAQDPNLLLQKAAYVVNAGKWPVLNRLEVESHLPGVALSEEMDEVLADDAPDLAEALAVPPAAGAALADKVGPEMAAAIMALPDELRQLAEMMLDDPGGCVRGTGTLNLAEVMRRTGWSFWKVKDRVTKMRRHLAPAASGTA
jgi:hypothetical protein